MSDDREPQQEESPRRKPGRPSKKTEALIDLAEAMLGKAEKRTIKAAVMKQSGCSPRTAEDVISAARERLRQQVNEPIDVLRATYLAVYNSIAFDTTREAPSQEGVPGKRKVSDRDRIMAASAAAKLLGLENHAQVPPASKADLIREFFEDPANSAAIFPPSVLPSAPPPPDEPTDRPVAAADRPTDEAMEGDAAARRAAPAL